MEYGVGIIGTGNIAETHANAVLASRGVRLVACYNHNAAKGDAFASRFGIRSYHDLDGFLSDADVDIVMIATPSGAHLEPALSAIESGKKAVIVEKPMEITTARCDAMIEAAERKGVLLAGIFQSRYFKAVRLLKNALDEGRFGRVTMISAQFNWYRTQEYYDDVPWHGTKALDGGGVLINQGIHTIDLLRWFGGDVDSVSSFCGALGHERIEVEDTGVASIRFKSGALGIIEGTTASYPGSMRRVEICGIDGSALLAGDSIGAWDFKDERPEDAAIKASIAEATAPTWGASTPSVADASAHAENIEDVVRALEAGTEPMVSGREARKAVELVEAIYDSAYSGKVIRL